MGSDVRLDGQAPLYQSGAGGPNRGGRGPKLGRGVPSDPPDVVEAHLDGRASITERFYPSQPALAAVPGGASVAELQRLVGELLATAQPGN